ncbi:hypothetical protein HFO98_10345 [Rhizobium leguminosarum]|uniref:hypothetical protein n=1 Tax=Rhizobium leguminosarum TaxID=384 RepID=UPI001C93C1D7|nr:hypothetical protein [Rhizobium leguminosarum]MBY5408869.1 hypothetical protein [Rhizobium leguminosarum]
MEYFSLSSACDPFPASISMPGAQRLEIAREIIELSGVTADFACLDAPVRDAITDDGKIVSQSLRKTRRLPPWPDVDAEVSELFLDLTDGRFPDPAVPVESLLDLIEAFRDERQPTVLDSKLSVLRQDASMPGPQPGDELVSIKILRKHWSLPDCACE